MVLRQTTRRRMFLTDTGYMGLAYQTTEVGDFVYLLLGADKPVILKRHPEDAGVFRFSGESYVHGLMDGAGTLRCKAQEGSGMGGSWGSFMAR